MGENKIGEINYNEQNLKMKIIEFRNIHNIDIQFENGIILKHKEYSSFEKATIRNPYKKAVLDVGIIVYGKYSTHKDKKMTIQYKSWVSMLKRCYEDVFLEKHPTYIGCSVCEEWHNFQIFAEWFDENYYQVDNEKMNLDKDILVKRNKIYSPETCCFVPARINSLFVKNDARRGDYPIGVYLNKRDNKYIANCKNISNKTINIGIYNTPKDAFYLGYKPFKENTIKKVADYYKDKISDKLYNAMYNWRVEITD